MPFSTLREAREARRLYNRDPGRFERDLQEAVDNRQIDGRVFSLRSVFEAFVDDGHEILQSTDRGRGGVQLMEAGVDTAAFAHITGQIVYSEVLQAFDDETFIGPQLARTVPTQFSGEKVPGVSKLGDVTESIAESEAYPIAGVGEEWVETPETTKRGVIVPVTKEAIFFDRTGLVLDRARNVAQAMGIDKEKRIIDAACGVTTLYRRNGAAAVATYGDDSGTHDWDNLAASNGLEDWSDIENALLLFDGLTDPNTGEPIVVNPKQILVPSALLMTARYILTATEVRETTNTNTLTVGANPLTQGGTPFSIVSSRYVKARTSSATTWFIGDFPGAVWYMENWGITSVEAPPNSEVEFTHDIVSRYKVSERGAVAVVEPRKVVKSTA